MHEKCALYQFKIFISTVHWCCPNNIFHSVKYLRICISKSFMRPRFFCSPFRSTSGLDWGDKYDRISVYLVTQTPSPDPRRCISEVETLWSRPDWPRSQQHGVTKEKIMTQIRPLYRQAVSTHIYIALLEFSYAVCFICIYRLYTKK